MEENLDNARRQPKKIYNRAALTATEKQLEARIASAKAELAQLEKKLPLLKQQAQAFKELFQLAEVTHKKGRVVFRVYYLAGDHEVTVLQADM
jgi:hypothetical protein